MRKKLAAVMLAAVMSVISAGCGSLGSGKEVLKSSGFGSGRTSITILNTKSEVQTQFEEMAEAYSAAAGVDVKVYYTSDVVSAHLSTRYSANNPYTISMVDPKDVYSLAAEHAADLSDQEWVDQTDHEISVGGKVAGFPVCIEARGLLYNADAVEAVTGKKFKPKKYTSLDKFQKLLKQLSENGSESGMEAPAGIIKEDWSLGAHFLCEVYEEQGDVEGFITSLYEGKAGLADNKKWNALMDFMDVMIRYNYAAESPITAVREVTEQKLAEGKIAFMFGGSWDWSVINTYDHSENIGIMPVPQNTDDGADTKLVGGGSKYFIIDASDNTSDEQRQAAKDFLNWLASSEEGISFLTKDCALVPACENKDTAALELNPLAAAVKKYADQGNLIPNYDHMPDDHYYVCGAAFQRYLAGQTDRSGLALEIESYWSAAAPAGDGGIYGN